MKVLNIGSGPVADFAIPGMSIIHADKHNFGPNIQVQDMEGLFYPDNWFDLVVCINALDHTRDAQAAVEELIRVSRCWVYIKCWLDQKQTGYKHYWDAKEDGTFTNGETTFDLKDFGFKIKYTDTHGERRYSFIEATLQKDA